MKLKYHAVVKQRDAGWIGWIEEVPGVNSEGATRKVLLDNLRSALEEALEMNRADILSAAESAPSEEVRATQPREAPWARMEKEKPAPSPESNLVRSQIRAAWASAFAAMLAVPISLFALYQSHAARVASGREVIAVQARRYHSNFPITVNHVGAPQWAGTLTTFWEVLLANNGDRTVSVIEHDVYSIVANQSEVYYSGIDQGLVDAKTLMAETLPVRLDPGESRRLLLRLGVIPGSYAYPMLRSEAAKGPESSFQRVEKLLASKGIDIYDNRVDPQTDSGKIVGWRVRDTRRQQVFAIKFRTARGSVVADTTSWYDFQQF